MMDMSDLVAPDRHRARGGSALAGAVRELYREGQTDYSLEPIVLVDAQGEPIGRIEDGDAVVFCCRRGEREIQLTEAFVERERELFPRRDFRNLHFRDPDAVPRKVQGPAGRLCADQDQGHPGRNRQPGGPAPAPRRRIGKVRARHLLLQRRQQPAVPRRGRCARSVAQGGPVRPGAGAERGAGRRAGGARHRQGGTI